MRVLVWLHLIGAALWLGGLVTLATAVLVGVQTLPRELFRHFVRQVGWAFAGLSALAWLLIGTSGLAMAAGLQWPELAVAKTELGGAILVASALHVVTGRLTHSRTALMTSRALAMLVFAATLAVFWLGVQLAS
ncbi:MAG: hypothetical protein M3072_16630 [Candidatus Dormibacteraeota bacterium]|nr:hypothetical protein [Candidatus Dormibacteraeota bacterium]